MFPERMIISKSVMLQQTRNSGQMPFMNTKGTSRSNIISHSTEYRYEEYRKV